jgi:hypothetical protein
MAASQDCFVIKKIFMTLLSMKRFRLVDHSKTGQISPVLKWSGYQMPGSSQNGPLKFWTYPEFGSPLYTILLTTMSLTLNTVPLRKQDSPAFKWSPLGHFLCPCFKWSGYQMVGTGPFCPAFKWFGGHFVSTI